ncbi:hypothetical protein [Saccharothrix syringae]|nr:hypothetical protein [Saccharothrix syringae]
MQLVAARPAPRVGRPVDLGRVGPAAQDVGGLAGEPGGRLGELRRFLG